MMNKKIGFIGAGKMAEAIMGGMISRRLVDPGNILIFDPSPDRSSYVTQTFGVKSLLSNEDICNETDIIILAVKPQSMKALLEKIAGVVNERHLFISIAAGIPTSFIKDILGENVRVVRTMPNTPCLLGEGMTAVAVYEGLSMEDKDVVVSIFNSVGRTAEVTEDQINAVTAVSGSGPAFFYEIIKTFVEGAVSQGLDEKTALILANQTMRGASAMIERTGKGLDELIQMVSSPGGTTVAGLAVLQSSEMQDIISETIAAARRRADELSKG